VSTLKTQSQGLGFAPSPFNLEDPMIMFVNYVELLKLAAPLIGLVVWAFASLIINHIDRPAIRQNAGD
jgi:hypothetical protein